VQVQYEVELVTAGTFGTLKIDRFHLAARLDALAVVLALGHVDMVRVVDRLLRTGVDARVTARADVEVDRVCLLPFGLERSEVTLDRDRTAGPQRVAPRRRQFRLNCIGHDDRYAELVDELLRPCQCARAGTGNQQLPSRLV